MKEKFQDPNQTSLEFKEEDPYEKRIRLVKEIIKIMNSGKTSELTAEHKEIIEEDKQVAADDIADLYRRRR